MYLNSEVDKIHHLVFDHNPGVEGVNHHPSVVALPNPLYGLLFKSEAPKNGIDEFDGFTPYLLLVIQGAFFNSEQGIQLQGVHDRVFRMFCYQCVDNQHTLLTEQLI